LSVNNISDKMSLSLEEIIKKQAKKMDQLEVRISELEAEKS